MDWLYEKKSLSHLLRKNLAVSVEGYEKRSKSKICTHQYFVTPRNVFARPSLSDVRVGKMGHIAYTFSSLPFSS